jgi:hypothetical protein
MPLTQAESSRGTSILSGAAGGAGIGAAIMPGIGTAIGAGLGAVYGAFASDPEEERAKRKQELLASIAQYRTQALQRGVATINAATTQQMSNVRAGASRRMASLGKTGDAEAFIAPGQQQVATAGSNSLEGFVNSTNQQYDQAELGVSEDWAARPMADLTGTVEALGVAGLQYKGAQERIQAMKDIYGTGDKSTGEKPGPTDGMKFMQDSGVQSVQPAGDIQSYSPPDSRIDITQNDINTARDQVKNAQAMGDLATQVRPSLASPDEIASARTRANLSPNNNWMNSGQLPPSLDQIGKQSDTVDLGDNPMSKPVGTYWGANALKRRKPTQSSDAYAYLMTGQ